jgi:hypothetical protein
MRTEYITQHNIIYEKATERTNDPTTIRHMDKGVILLINGNGEPLSLCTLLLAGVGVDRLQQAGESVAVLHRDAEHDGAAAVHGF